jgi:hypothetical protein
MPKPFSDLERQAIAILANGGNPANSSDTALARYWQWKINPSAASHNLPADSTRTANRKKDPIYLVPFGVDLPAATFAKVQITRRTNTALPPAVKTAVAHRTTTATDFTPRLKNFAPAYVYWRTGAATDSTPRTSRITGRPYKSYFAAADEGYLAPFGRTAATDSEADRQRAIAAAFPAPAPGILTFLPEKYRG